MVSSSISDQLIPLRHQMRVGRPEVKPVVQVTSEVSGSNPIAAAHEARDAVLTWLRDKQSIRGIPDRAWTGESFEVDASQDRPVVVEAHSDIWAMRFDNPDSRVNGRYWRTEAVVAALPDKAVVGIRLTVISREWDRPYLSTVPTVVQALCTKPGLTDYDAELRATAGCIETHDDVAALILLLEDPRRTRPVYVASESNSGTYLIDPNFLALRTAGLAHVAKISTDAAWNLSEELGNRLSVYGGALRTYRPGFDRFNARWDDHPLATEAWLRNRFPNANQFSTLLIETAISQSISFADLDHRLPSFSTIRQSLSKQRIDAARSENVTGGEMLKLYEEDNRKLREELEAAEDLLGEKARQQTQSEEQIDQLQRQNYTLRSRIEQLEQLRQSKGAQETISPPTGYDVLDEWIGKNFGDRIVLLARASRALKRAEFQDLDLVAKVIQLMATSYRSMRLGEMEKSAFDDEANRLGVEFSRAGSDASLLQWKEDYEVAWGREKRLLNEHVKRGNSREPRNCLRIYFFWDEDRQQVIVGHLPSHLTNDLT